MIPDQAITVRHLDTPEQQESALAELMGVMGFEIVMVGEAEHLLPTDKDHPDYAKCLRKIERARKAAA